MNLIVETLRDFVLEDVHLEPDDDFEQGVLKFLAEKDFDGLVCFVAGYVTGSDRRLRKIEKELGLYGEEASEKEAGGWSGSPLGRDRFAGEADSESPTNAEWSSSRTG